MPLEVSSFIIDKRAFEFLQRKDLWNERDQTRANAKVMRTRINFAYLVVHSHLLTEQDM